MELYFGYPESEHTIVLDEAESAHLLKIKRASVGDSVSVTDGNGNLYHTQIKDTRGRSCSLEIMRTERKEKRSPLLHIGIAPTKNIDRTEWFLEKATEMGVDQVSFLICRHSERREVKPQRLHRVLVAAIKQSHKYFLPTLNAGVDFNSFVAKNSSDTKIICCLPNERTTAFNEAYKSGQGLSAIIGPEGDFHADEIEWAVKHGYTETSLGPYRLRTETAGLAACAFFNFMNAQ